MQTEPHEGGHRGHPEVQRLSYPGRYCKVPLFAPFWTLGKRVTGYPTTRLRRFSSKIRGWSRSGVAVAGALCGSNGDTPHRHRLAELTPVPRSAANIEPHPTSWGVMRRHRV